MLTTVQRPTPVHLISASSRRLRGATLLEVLVSLFIMTIGLLGVAGLQARMQAAEIEAYQRTQAIILMQNMVDRISANRSKAAVESYVTAAPLGTNSTLDCSAPGTDIALKDKCEWSSALAGAAETTSPGGVTTTLGAMNEARGCITNPGTVMPREIVVAVVWQGLISTVAPTSTTCGQGLAAYGSDDKLRRAMITRIKIACLHNDISTGACVTP